MDSPDREEYDQDQHRDDDRSGDRQVVGTYDPAIVSGPAPRVDLDAHPERSLVIETNRIREPDEAPRPNMVLVPVEIGGPSRGPNEPGHSDRDEGARTNEERKKDEPRDQGRGAGREPSKPSPWRNRLITGAIALACGVLGAWAFSAFSGPGKSDDQGGSASKGSDSKGGSGSGQGSKSGKSSNPGQGPGSGRDSDMSQGDRALMTAMDELRQARADARAARQAEADSKAVLQFVKMTLLSAGRPGDASLAEAFWAGGQGKDVSLRKAVDLAESRAGEAFANQPLAEATVREMLGSAYLNLGEPAPAVKQFERALALRQAIRGFDDPETASCRNQLAVAYRLAGRADEGGRLFDRNTGSIAEAAALEARGMALLFENQPAEAEIKLRESLAIRQKAQPDAWATFDARSEVGEALLNQKKFADAEPLLLAGYQGLKRREDSIPAAEKARIARALERIVRLYESWGKKDEAARWRKTLLEEGPK